ncbi:hypothetical protein PR048_023677 [Dryococelus australis]|uniref:Uncharacterized protein n=1 Tax=Dryococelus australis TaxID=614101 RepID=A0ABQ9GUV0_9NEOP|nr:hypothetical protein PR048_023677 [Dryococelus australis]
METGRKRVKSNPLLIKRIGNNDSKEGHGEKTKEDIAKKAEERNKNVFQITKKDQINTNIGSAVAELESNIVKFMNHVANIYHPYQDIKYLKENILVMKKSGSCRFQSTGNPLWCFKTANLHYILVLHILQLKVGSKTYFHFVLFLIVFDITLLLSGLTLILCLKYLLQQCPQVKILNFLSDSPSTQYRNKKNFCLFQSVVERYPLVTMATWNFGEAGHGKAALDGVGGCLKHTVDCIITQGKDITNLTTLFDILEENCPNIKLWEIPEDSILKFDEILRKEELVTVKVNQVTVSSTPSTHSYRALSCMQCAPDQNCQHFEIVFSSDLQNSPALFKQDTSSVYSVREWVIVIYEGQTYLGEIMCTDTNGGKTVTINAMEPTNYGRTAWKWLQGIVMCT